MKIKAETPTRAQPNTTGIAFSGSPGFVGSMKIGAVSMFGSGAVMSGCVFDIFTVFGAGLGSGMIAMRAVSFFGATAGLDGGTGGGDGGRMAGMACTFRTTGGGGGGAGTGCTFWTTGGGGGTAGTGCTFWTTGGGGGNGTSGESTIGCAIDGV